VVSISPQSPHLMWLVPAPDASDWQPSRPSHLSRWLHAHSPIPHRRAEIGNRAGGSDGHAWYAWRHSRSWRRSGGAGSAASSRIIAGVTRGWSGIIHAYASTRSAASLSATFAQAGWVRMTYDASLTDVIW